MLVLFHLWHSIAIEDNLSSSSSSSEIPKQFQQQSPTPQPLSVVKQQQQQQSPKFLDGVDSVLAEAEAALKEAAGLDSTK